MKILILQQMKKLLIFATMLFTINFANAQKVYSVGHDSQAEIKVFVVGHDSQADLKVFKVSHESQAGNNDGLWFFTGHESQAKKKIYFVGHESQADLKIYFVGHDSQAGWKNSSKKHLLYQVSNVILIHKYNW